MYTCQQGLLFTLTPEITIGFTTPLTLPAIVLAWLKTNIFTPI